MSDSGAAFTDKELAKLEKEITSIYKKASKDIKQKLNEFNSKYAIKEQIHLQELADGKITQEQFDAWKKGQIFQGKQWEAKRDQIQDTIANANSIATNILNGHMTNAFTTNANFMSYQMEHDTGINFGFGIYDSATVANLLKNDPQLLPKWKINEPKDYIWNKKNVRTAVTQGIIQGEKLDQIADRLAKGLSTKNKNKMLTFARTAMTGAQNAGRIYSLNEAKNLGIDVEKQWMCTLDSHTRINHRLLDGQTRPNDEPFEINGYKIMYPGDPKAAPEMVYNCRCTLVGNVKKYPATYDRYDNIDGKPIKNMSYSDWEEAKKKGEDISPVPLTWKKFVDKTNAQNIKELFSEDPFDLPDKVSVDIFNIAFVEGYPDSWMKMWEDYINNSLIDPDGILEKKIEDVLTKYAKDNGLIKVDTTSGVFESTVKGLFSDKKMSNIYNDIKAYDTKAGNQFYNELKGIGKPSEVWQKYLDGTLSNDQMKKIDSMLEAYAKGSGLIKEPINVKEMFDGKKMSSVYNEMKNVDSKAANQFYGELKNIGKPSDVWNKYMDGTLDADSAKKIDSILEKYLGKSDKTQSVVPNAANAANVAKTQKTAKDIAETIKSANTLEDAQKALQEAQDAINKAHADKVFKGIWKDDVTYADYEAKKASIQAKKDYYLDQISKAKAKGITNKQFEQYLKELEEFEKNGKAYSQLYKNLDAAKDKVKSLTPVVTSGKQFADDAFSESVKKAAHSFSNKNVADKFHRKELDKIWDNLSDKEKYAVWEYTRNSNPMNKSLSGYHDTWSRSDYLGPANTKWGHEDSWRSLPSAFKKFGKNGNVSYHDAITNATTAIEKSSLADGVWLVRGSDKNGFAGMIEGDVFSFGDAKKLLDSGSINNIKKALEGQVIQNHAFTSTGIASGTGFGGDVAYKIYAPRGTHAIYAEPQSYFGNTVGSNAKLYRTGQSYSSVGGEAEVILQRGTEFKITNITGSGNRYTVEMEIVAQPDYFKYGDEDTYNGGATRHKK